MKRAARIYWPYLALTLAILLPLLKPGYIFALDAVFTPTLHMPATVSNDYLWLGLQHVLSLIMPSYLIEKALFAGIVLGAGIGMHRLALWLGGHTAKPRMDMAWRISAYLAGLMYVANPYTYDRFMAGQYGMLVGYAVLPWFVQACWRFAMEPRRQTLLMPLFLAVAVSVVSIPNLAELFIIALAVLTAAWWGRKELFKRGVSLLAAGGAMFLLLSSYWLVPFAAGKGTLAATVSQFDATHAAAFATLGSNIVTKSIHVLRLQGFWAEAHQLFVLPGDRLPGWGLVQLAIWALVGYGAVQLWRRARRFAAATFATLGAGLLLAIGMLPLAGIGYREPQKFAGLVALAFAVFVLYGSARLIARAGERSETNQALLGIAGLVVLFAWTPTMYWGFGGQLRAADYPREWYELNRRLNQDHGNFSVLSLPWHQYMSYSFAGRIIANPTANGFFDKPVIASDNPELGNIRQSAANPDTAAMARILTQTPRADFARQLADHNIKYIVLFKEYDYQRYAYLKTEPGILVEQDTPRLTLYRSQAWKERQ